MSTQKIPTCKRTPGERFGYFMFARTGVFGFGEDESKGSFGHDTLKECLYELEQEELNKPFKSLRKYHGAIIYRGLYYYVKGSCEHNKDFLMRTMSMIRVEKIEELQDSPGN